LAVNTSQLWRDYEHSKSRDIIITAEGVQIGSCEAYVHQKDKSFVLTSYLPLDFALDPNDILYILDRKKNQILRINISSNISYSIDCNSSDVPKSIAAGQRYIHILYENSYQIIDKYDTGLQITINVAINKTMKFIVLDGYENPYVFDFLDNQIYRIDISSRSKQPILRQSDQTRIPSHDDKYNRVLRMAIGQKNDKIYLLTNHKVLIFSLNGVFEREIDIHNLQGFLPSDISLNRDGNMCLSNNWGGGDVVSPIIINSNTGKTTIMQYYERSERIFASRLSNDILYIISLGNDNNLGLGQQIRLEQISKVQRYLKYGEYISNPLDSHIVDLGWHKLLLESETPEETSVEVYYCTSKDGNVQNWIKIPVSNPNDTLILDDNGRYIMFRLVLKSENGIKTPTVRGLKALFPRRSYLRYLPVIYQEDKNSREFLERFLSLFESFFMDLEGKTLSLARYFDVNSAPDNFIPWLASWVGLKFDERWPTDFIRRLIQKAPELSRDGGTRNGLQEMISLYLDTEKSNVIIFEGFQLTYIEDMKTKTNFSEMLFGEDNPIYSFCVLLRSRLVDDDRLEVIKQIIEDEKPAHSIGHIGLLLPRFILNQHTYLGVNAYINSEVEDKRGFVIGSSIVETASKFTNTERSAVNGENC
jgi:phage tail-like protein